MGERLPEIASLWIGPRLSVLEQLCLQSFLDAGHRVTLFCYAPVAGVPEGVRIEDARQIYENDDILIHAGKNSPAIHADVFRAKLVRTTSMIWVDCDAYCLRPFTTASGYFFGIDQGTQAANGVLGAPKSSPALELLDRFLSTRGARPPWWDEATTELHLAQHGDFRFETMKWATTGPQALTWFLNDTGEISEALPKPVLYPLPSLKKRLLLRRPLYVKEYLKPETVSVHLYSTGLRGLVEEQGLHPRSFLGRLCEKHGIPLTGL